MLRLRGIICENRQFKRLLVIVSMLSLVFLLTACGTAPVSENSTGTSGIAMWFILPVNLLSGWPICLVGILVSGSSPLP